MKVAAVMIATKTKPVMCAIIAIGHTQPRKLLADASALNTVIPLAFASEFGFRVDDAMVNGTGAGQPLGMLNAGSLITVSKEAGQAPGTLLGENVMKMYARLFAGSEDRAVWLANKNTLPQLMQMGSYHRHGWRFHLTACQLQPQVALTPQRVISDGEALSPSG